VNRFILHLHHQNLLPGPGRKIRTFIEIARFVPVMTGAQRVSEIRELDPATRLISLFAFVKKPDRLEALLAAQRFPARSREHMGASAREPIDLPVGAATAAGNGLRVPDSLGRNERGV
jgi:hypothetical protein